MGFIIGLVALIAAYCTWQYRYSDAAFQTYVTTKMGPNGARWKVCLWIAVGFAAWAMLTFNPVPAYVALLFFLVVWIVWLSSEAGQSWLKSLA